MRSHSLAAWFIRSKFCDHSGNYSMLLKAINVVIYCVHKKVKRIKKQITKSFVSVLSKSISVSI